MYHILHLNDKCVKRINFLFLHSFDELSMFTMRKCRVRYDSILVILLYTLSMLDIPDPLNYCYIVDEIYVLICFVSK